MLQAHPELPHSLPEWIHPLQPLLQSRPKFQLAAEAIERQPPQRVLACQAAQALALAWVSIQRGVEPYPP